jgi:hypothetical protein
MHDDPLLERLRALPVRPLDAAAHERTLRRARAVLAAERPEGAWLRNVWARLLAPVLVPTLVTVTVAGYLILAVSAAGSLYR